MTRTQTLKASVCLVAMLTLIGCETAKNVAQSAADTIDAGVEAVFGDGEFFSSGYIDEGDACVAQRRALADESSPFDKQLVQTVLAGAAVGGIVAAVRGDNVLAGAAIGAGVGLAAGYLSKLQREGRSPLDVVTSVNNDLDADNRRIDRVIAAFDNIVACRKNEAARIQAAFQSGQITRAEAEEQMAAVRQKYDEDVERTREVAERISENADAYAAAYNEIAADNGQNALEVREYTPPQQRTQQSVVVKQAPPERQTTTDQVASLEVAPEERSEIAELRKDTVSNVEKRDAAFDRVETAAADTSGFSLG